MKSFLRIITLFLSFSLFAGPWTPEKGKGYAQLSWTFLGYNSGFDADGEVFDLPKEVTDQTVQLYSEVGLGKSWSFVGILPFKSVSTETNTEFETDNSTDSLIQIPNGSLSGLGNIQVSVKKSISLSKGYQLGFELEGYLPTAQFEADKQLFTGRDDWGVKPSVSIGKGADKYYGFASIGYLFLEDYQSQFQFHFEVAPKFKLGSKTGFIGLVLDVALTGDDYFVNAPQTYLYSDGSSYVSPGLKINVELAKGFELNLGAYGAFSARFNGASPTLNAGIGYKW